MFLSNFKRTLMVLSTAFFVYPLAASPEVEMHSVEGSCFTIGYPGTTLCGPEEMDAFTEEMLLKVKDMLGRPLNHGGCVNLLNGAAFDGNPEAVISHRDMDLFMIHVEVALSNDFNNTIYKHSKYHTPANTAQLCLLSDLLRICHARILSSDDNLSDDAVSICTMFKQSFELLDAILSMDVVPFLETIELTDPESFASDLDWLYIQSNRFKAGISNGRESTFYAGTAFGSYMASLRRNLIALLEGGKFCDDSYCHDYCGSDNACVERCRSYGGWDAHTIHNGQVYLTKIYKSLYLNFDYYHEANEDRFSELDAIMVVLNETRDTHDCDLNNEDMQESEKAIKAKLERCVELVDAILAR